LAPTATFQYEVIKIGMDVDLRNAAFERQIDNSTPQPPQKVSREKFMAFVAQQKKLARRVVTCYEAGCFGYKIHRDLVALGVESLVIAPEKWNPKGKTDKKDAHEILVRLDRYVAGNKRALTPVRVPTPAEDRSRSRSRFRQQLLQERQRLANKGKSLVLYFGLHINGRWWRELARTVQLVQEKMAAETAAEVIDQLEVWQKLAMDVQKQLDRVTRELRAARPSALATPAPAAGQKNADSKKGDVDAAESPEKTKPAQKEARWAALTTSSSRMRQAAMLSASRSMPYRLDTPTAN
jgi:transposase